MLLIAAKVLLNYMGRYKEAVEYAGKAWNELDEDADPNIRATVNYVYAVCCSKYADSHKYACERVHLKEETMKLLVMAQSFNPQHSATYYFLAREEAESGNATDALKNAEQSLKLDKRNAQCLALYALILTMQGNNAKAHAVADEGYKFFKDNPSDGGFALLGLIKVEIEIHQALHTQEMLLKHEKDCLRAVQGHKGFLKQLATLQDVADAEESKDLARSETKKIRENETLVKTMREDCLKNYEELVRTVEEEYKKNNINRSKKYRVGEKPVEGMLAHITMLLYYVKACIRLGDVEKASAGYDKISKDYNLTCPASLYCVNLFGTTE